MTIEIEEINVSRAVVSSDVHWVNGFTQVIEVTVKINRKVKGYFELRYVCWIDWVIGFIKMMLFKIL